MTQVPECYIEKNYVVGNELKTDRIDLGVVKSIEDVITADLMEIPLITYPASQRFIMDLGTTRKFIVNFERVNPADYNDLSDDKNKWSNSKWYSYFRDFFDVWQNFMTDDTGKMRGGFTLNYMVPTSANDLYPSIIETRVFLSGAIQPEFGVGKMSISLPLQVANMEKGEVHPEYVQLTLDPSHAGLSEEVMSVPKGVPFRVPGVPDIWLSGTNSEVFVSWSLLPGEVGSIEPGSLITIDSDQTWYSYWEPVLLRDVVMGAIGQKTEVDYSVPGGSKRVKVIMAGGGGGAGGSIKYKDGWGEGGWAGGGGGSGEVYVGTFSLPYSPPGQTHPYKIHIELGEGGLSGVTREDKYISTESGGSGKDGGDTTLFLNNRKVVCHGGKGGKGGSKNGAAGGLPGGNYAGGGGLGGRTKESGTDGEPGKYGLDIEGIKGKGSRWMFTTNEVYVSSGGGGGGASGVNFSYYPIGSQDPILIQSKGGDSHIYISVGSSGKGVKESLGSYGGGGGALFNAQKRSDDRYIGGHGGPGFVYLEFM